MNIKKIISILLIILVIILLGAGGFWFFKIKNVETPQRDVSAPEREEKNYFEINDELAGVYFKIGKKFDRMAARDLQIKNPNFIYGFLAADDKNVSCYISQTKREKPGVVKVADLRDGVFNQLKEIYPSAQLDSAEIKDVGENNNKGAKLKMKYADGDVPKFQWEVAGITQKSATFAFCEIPQAVVDLYREDVDLFLDSVRIK